MSVNDQYKFGKTTEECRLQFLFVCAAMFGLPSSPRMMALTLVNDGALDYSVLTVRVLRRLAQRTDREERPPSWLKKHRPMD